MFSKSTIVMAITIALTSTLATAQLGFLNARRPALNEGGVLSGVGSLVGDLTTGVNGALGGQPMYRTPQGYVPMQYLPQGQQMQAMQQPSGQTWQFMQPMQVMQQMQGAQQQMRPFQRQFRTIPKEQSN